MKKDDVLLLSNGKMLQVVEKGARGLGLDMVLYIDNDSVTITDLERLDIAHNLGHGPVAVGTFHMIRGIHERLNKLAKV